MINTPLFTTSIDLSLAENHYYDVIVVGAGPAGSAAAYHLARQGVDVLLLDRYTFPRNKCCGDAVMPPALEELALMGLADEVLSHYALAKGVGVWFYDLPPNYSPIDASDHFGNGCIAPRASFDALLCNHALQQGASWLDNVVIQGIEGNETTDYIVVRGMREERAVHLHCHIVIAADGSGSRLGRQLRQKLTEQGDTTPLTAPEDQRVRFTAMRGCYTEIEDIHDVLEFYFRGGSGIHYYWIFPCNYSGPNPGRVG